jgi:hypothetical protein
MADPQINDIKKAAAALGRLGGLARINKLTPQQRSEHARRVAVAGWKKRKPKPTPEPEPIPIVQPEQEPKDLAQPEPFFEDGEWWIKQNGCYQSVPSPEEET